MPAVLLQDFDEVYGIVKNHAESERRLLRAQYPHTRGNKFVHTHATLRILSSGAVEGDITFKYRDRYW